MAPETLLRRADDLTIRLEANGAISVGCGSETVVCARHGLALLDAFSRPRRMAEALDLLRPRLVGAQDWIDLTNAVQGLWHAGILVGPNHRPGLRLQGNEYEFAPIHIAMLQDRARVSGYLEAIRKTVRPGDVVVDIGTGTGVLAVAAAKAGADRVYAVEARAIGAGARELFRENGFADRITLVEGWSTQVELPERADVLVSELIGNDPLAEWALEITGDARKRLLKPDARFVPRALSVYALPVEVPERVIRRYRFDPLVVQRWRNAYGIDFSPLLGGRWDAVRFYIRPRRARHWLTLAPPVRVAEIDFAEERSPTLESTVRVTAATAGLLTGVLTYFDLELSPGVVVTSDPARAAASNHWTCAVWLLREPRLIEEGQEFDVTYSYRVFGQPRVTVNS